MKKDYQTHVFTSTYTADVSGVCSALYELGGMSVLHDPSGCNSTYSTHDEPRWFDSDSLMYVSGIDEITAIMGDDDVLIRDVCAAAADLHPRFITLCGASIPHIIAFDYRGVAFLIEKECSIPVLPVPTDGLKSYVSGAGLALRAWIERFADPSEYSSAKDSREPSVNLIGVTPLDFSVNGNVSMLRKTFENAGFKVNTCMAMGDSFETMRHAYNARVNVVVSSAGEIPAGYMKKKCGIPSVRGLPAGEAQTEVLLEAVRQSILDGKDRVCWKPFGNTGRFEVPPGGILVIGEEIFAKSLANAVNLTDASCRGGLNAFPLWPDVDEGIPEDDLIRAIRSSSIVIADPLYRVVLRGNDPVTFIDFPHEAYSGRIFRSSIPEFAGPSFRPETLFESV